jgi:hypothetical protein
VLLRVFVPRFRRGRVRLRDRLREGAGELGDGLLGRASKHFGLDLGAHALVQPVTGFGRGAGMLGVDLPGRKRIQGLRQLVDQLVRLDDAGLGEPVTPAQHAPDLFAVPVLLIPVAIRHRRDVTFQRCGQLRHCDPKLAHVIEDLILGHGGPIDPDQRLNRGAVGLVHTPHDTNTL